MKNKAKSKKTSRKNHKRWTDDEIKLLKKGKLLDLVNQRRLQKKFEVFTDKLVQLVEFDEKLDIYLKNIKSVKKYTNSLINRFNNNTVSKEEMADNFVEFIERYDLSEWDKILKDLK